MDDVFHLIFRRHPGDATLYLCAEWQEQAVETQFRPPIWEKLPEEKPSREQVERAGSSLFAALFPPPLRGLLQQARERQGSSLRIRLSIPKEVQGREELEQIPWENALDPETQEFLGLSRRWLLIRDIGDLPAPAATERPSPLRILVVGASPEGHWEISLEKEYAAIRQAWGERAHVFPLLHATFGEFCAHLRELSTLGGVAAIHFIGHAGFSSNLGPEPMLLFEGGPKGEGITASELATQLEGRAGLEMVVLSACKTAKPASDWEHDPSRSIASALLRRGIPTVVATRCNVNDLSAVAFAEAFHTSLARGEDVASAATEGRRRLAEEWRDLKEDFPIWSIPVLYSQADRARLFGAAAPPKPENLRLTIATVDHRFAPQGAHRHVLRLFEHFEGRNLCSGESWDSIKKRLYDWLGQYVRMGQRVELQLDAYLSVSFAAGYFIGTRGCPITLQPFDSRLGARVDWQLSPLPQVRPQEKEWTFAPEEPRHGGELAVAVMVTDPSVGDDVRDYWASTEGKKTEVLVASLDELGHSAMPDADQTYRLAELLVHRIRKVGKGARIHLFLNGPATFAFYLGQLSGFLGEIHLYECDPRTRLYSPSLRVEPGDRLSTS